MSLSNKKTGVESFLLQLIFINVKGKKFNL